MAFGAGVADQFGAALSPQPPLVWGVSGGGTIDGSGLFSAGASVGGPYTVTAQADGLTGTASVTVSTLAAPADLSAYATGSGRIALYWVQVPGAAGYNIYRGTSAGGEDYAHPVNGATPVSAPSYPGSSMDLFTDTGLTDGTLYFYTVEAVAGTNSSSPSPEDSAAPDPTAIPWDGTPAAILSTIRQQESGQPGLQFSQSYAALRVVGPDGAIYQEGDPNQLPPDGSLDPENGTMTLNGITTPTHFADEQSGQTDGSAFASASALLPQVSLLPLDTTPPPKTTPGGGIRRVTSTPGINSVSSSGAAVVTPFTGVEETVYLPSTADSSSILVAPTQNGVGEKPQTYVGMTSKSGVEVDAGIQLNPPIVLHNPDGTDMPLPQRWSAFMRIADGRTKKDANGNVIDPDPTRTDNNGYMQKGEYRVIGLPNPYIVAASLLGGDAILNFAVDPKHNLCSFVVFGFDVYGLYYAQWYVAAVGSILVYPTNSAKSLVGLRMKRETSLDQNIPSGTKIIGYGNLDKRYPKSTTIGYFPTGSYMKDIAWQDGELFVGGQEYDWTSDFNDSLSTLYTYLSMVGPSRDVVTLGSPVAGPTTQNPLASETVNIHN